MDQIRRKGFWEMINKQIFFPPAIILTIAVLLGLFNPIGFEKVASAVLNWILKYFSWFYALGTTMLLLFSIWAGFSKYGKIKLGGPDAKPELSTFSWFAISLCAGIAVGIVFYGVAEPMAHYVNPPPFLGVAPKSIESGECALWYSFFHWTFHTYGIYVSMAIPLAFIFFNCKKPYKVSSALYPLAGKRIFGRLGNWIDALAIFAIVGGVATSLGLGTMQIGGGMKFLWGVNPTKLVWFIIIIVLTFVYTISSYTGLQKGIKLLGKGNTYLYFFLIAFMLAFGPTVHILNSTVSAIGDYFSNLFHMSLYLDPMGKSDWTNQWSIFYWAWWLSFGPLVGLFFARCSYGRTIREVVTVNLIAPSAFGMIWFGVFGSSSIFLEHFKNAGISKLISENGIEVALFALFKQLPFAPLTMVLGILAISISFVTLANSMTSTIASMTTVGFGKSKEEIEAPAPMKMFWGLTMGVLAYVLLIGGGISALQTCVIVCGLPILVLQLVVAISYIKAMKNYKKYDLTVDKKDKVITQKS